MHVVYNQHHWNLNPGSNKDNNLIEMGLLLFIFLGSFTFPADAQQPILESAPNPPVYGRQWSFWCHSTKEIRYFFYYFNNNRIAIEDDDQPLTYSNYHERYDGAYRCVTQSRYFSMSSSRTKNIVGIDPVTVLGNVYKKNGVAWIRQSQAVTLHCPYTPSNISWYKDGDLILKHPSKSSLEKVIQQQDEGSYTCNSTSKKMAASVEIQVFTLNVTLKVSDDKRLVGSAVTLTCESQVSADTSISSYSFYKDGSLLGSQQQSNKHIVNIQSLESIFHCGAESNWTISVNSSSVFVKSRVLNVTLKVSDDRRLVGSTVTLTCESQVSADTSISSYSFYKDGNLFGAQQQSNERIVTFQSLSLFHCGAEDNWTISVNSLSFVKARAFAAVNITTSSLHPAYGVNVNLTCSVVENPFSQIERIIFYINDSVVLNSTSDTLSLNRFNENHTGSYHCKVVSNWTDTISSIKISLKLRVPSEPRLLAIFHNDTKKRLIVSWQEPFPTNGDILEYIVCYTQLMNDGTSVNRLQEKCEPQSGNLRTKTFDKLDAFSVYQVKVTARNGAGLGPSVIENGTTLEEVPSEPTLLAVVHNDTKKRLIVSWQEPFPTNGDILEYFVCYTQLMNDGTSVNKSQQKCEPQSGNLPTKTFDKLDAFSVYQVKVTARNGAGLGPSVMENGTTLEEEPQNVTNIQFLTTNSSLTVIWDKPKHVYGVLQGYTVEYKEDSSNLAYAVPLHCHKIMTTNCTVNNLTAFTKYDVKIVISNRLHTNFILYQDIQTKTGPPPPYTAILPSPNTNDVTTKSFSVKLVQFYTINGPIDKYIIVAKKLASGTNPSRQPSTYSKQNIEDGIDGLFVVHIETDRNKFGTTIEISSKSTTNRKRRAITVSDFTLDPDTYYTVFVRGVTKDGEYQTTTWYTPIKLNSDGLAVAAIAGIVIAVMIALLMWYFLYYKRKLVQKSSQDVKMASIKNSDPSKNQLYFQDL